MQLLLSDIWLENVLFGCDIKAKESDLIVNIVTLLSIFFFLSMPASGEPSHLSLSLRGPMVANHIISLKAP